MLTITFRSSSTLAQPGDQAACDKKATRPEQASLVENAERNDSNDKTGETKRKLADEGFDGMKLGRSREIVELMMSKWDWIYPIAATAHNLLRTAKSISINRQP